MNETMGNQQQIPTGSELGWLAGIIEGEGSIVMNVRRKEWNGWKSVGVDLAIIICNKDAAIIAKCDEILRNIGTSPHLCEGKTVNPIMATLKDGTVKTYHNPNRPLLQLQLSKMGSIKTVLEILMPHMHGDKKHRAKLIVEFVGRRLERKGAHTKNGSSWYDNYDWQIVDKFYKITGGKLLPEVAEMLRDYTMGAKAQKAKAMI